MEKGIEKMMLDAQKPTEQPGKPTRFELTENIRVAGFWLKALKRGTFLGEDAVAVASLCGFVEKQLDLSTKEFEAESLTHPEWGSREPNKEVAAVS